MMLQELYGIENKNKDKPEDEVFDYSQRSK